MFDPSTFRPQCRHFIVNALLYCQENENALPHLGHLHAINRYIIEQKTTEGTGYQTTAHVQLPCDFVKPYSSPVMAPCLTLITFRIGSNARYPLWNAAKTAIISVLDE